MSIAKVTWIFFTITFAVFTVQTSAIVWPWTKHTVIITNDMSSNQQPLKFHCWSRDDNLGNHTLYMKGNFQFHFREDNLYFDTKFFCDMQHGTQKQSLSVYPHHCNTFKTCYWSVREDGFYVGKRPNSLHKVLEWK